MQTEWIKGTGQDTRHAGSTLWLISRGTNPLLEPLLVDGSALAVFGHEEEAEMFLGLRESGNGWRVHEVGAWEFASFLRGPYRPVVRRVALDPLPGNLAGSAFGFLACTDRDRFADHISPVPQDRGGKSPRA